METTVATVLFSPFSSFKVEQIMILGPQWMKYVDLPSPVCICP